jgi:hypothetical protein
MLIHNDIDRVIDRFFGLRGGGIDPAMSTTMR